MRKLSSLVLTASLLVSGAAPALAQDWHHDDHHDRGGEHHHEAWHMDSHWHGDIFHFRDYDLAYWHGGHWVNGFHEGRNGWWWTVGGVWYYYPAPVYPYPDPYAPPGVTVVAGSPAPYYYCADPAGYYPYVSACAVAWQATAGTAPTTVVVQQPAPGPVVVAPPAASQRDADYAQLNAYSAELSHIDVNNRPVGLGQLKSLSRRVSAFRKVIATRGYNPIPLLKNIDDLKSRIAAEKSALGGAVVVMPASPAPIPPGATVTFPGQ